MNNTNYNTNCMNTNFFHHTIRNTLVIYQMKAYQKCDLMNTLNLIFVRLTLTITLN